MDAPEDNLGEGFKLVFFKGRSLPGTLPRGVNTGETENGEKTISVPWTGSYICRDGVLICTYDKKEFPIPIDDVSAIGNHHLELIWVNGEQPVQM